MSISGHCQLEANLLDDLNRRTTQITPESEHIGVAIDRQHGDPPLAIWEATGLCKHSPSKCTAVSSSLMPSPASVPFNSTSVTTSPHAPYQASTASLIRSLHPSCICFHPTKPLIAVVSDPPTFFGQCLTEPITLHLFAFCGRWRGGDGEENQNGIELQVWGEGGGGKGG